MKPIRLSLGTKFSIAVTALIVLIMLGATTLIINYQKESLRQNIFESNLAMTRNLAHDAESPLLMFDPLRLSELVRTAQEASSCVFALIVDRESIVVAHTSRAFLGSRAPDSAREPASSVAAGGETIREYSADRKLLKEFSVPIRVGTETIGVAVIAYSIEAMDEAIGDRLKNLQRYIYFITGIILLLGVAGAYGLSRLLLTKPLGRLKETMLDVQTGNLAVEVENDKLVRCWERLGCSKSDCPSFGKTRCWAIAGTFCHGNVQGTFAQKIGDCRRCVVYRESCGDEVRELVEVFNQMVKDLRYNLGELEKANTEKARLERLSALGEMATTVAHETKNPLNSIRLAASYLKKNFQGEILTEFLSIIEEEVGRLNDITSNFLGFSKPAPLKFRTGDMNAVVKSTVELVRQEATDRNIEMVILFDEHIPPMQFDVSRLKQALLNLLINALDASRAGDTITVITESAGLVAMLHIQDTGKGIPPEDREKIFKPFYTTKTRGSGLGLAIVDRIVKEHKGEITVESITGRGTKLTIALPVHEYAGT